MMKNDGKPNLPEIDGTPWCEETAAWFEAWKNSEATDSWSPIQWQYLFDTALVHMAVWYDGDLTKLGELRARETQMGISFAEIASKKSKATDKANLLKVAFDNRNRKASSAS